MNPNFLQHYFLIIRKAITRRDRSLTLIFACLAVLLWLPQLFHVAQLRSTNSDNATIILTGADLLKGNWLLRGWNLPPDSFITSDVLVYAFGGAIFGFNPFLMNLVPTIIYGGVIFLGIILAGVGSHNGRLLSGILAFGVLATPAYSLATLALEGPIHMGTILLCLLAYITTSGIFNSVGRKRLLLAGLTCLFLTMAVIGDPLALVIGVIPIGISAIIIWVVFRLKVCGYALLPALLAAISSLLSPVKTIPITPVITSEHLWKNLNLFEKSITTILIPSTVLMLASGGSIVWTISNLWTKRGVFLTTTLVDLLLLGGTSANILAFLFTSAPVDLATARYLLPAVIFSFILLAKRLSQLASQKRWVFVVVAAILLVPNLGDFTQLSLEKVENPPQAELIEWLNEHQLKVGYADYWDANIITVQSLNKIKVRPIEAKGLGFVPFRWNTKNEWYQDYPPTGKEPFFVIYRFQNFPKSVTISTKIMLDYLRFLVTFGKPSLSEVFGEYQIFAWNID